MSRYSSNDLDIDKASVKLFLLSLLGVMNSCSTPDNAEEWK